MPIPKEIPFQTVVDALLDESVPFHPRYLHRLSDLPPADSDLLKKAWPKVSARRRQAVMEDLEELNLADDLLSFEEVGRLALTDSEPAVRRLAIRILGEYELKDLAPTFIKLLEQDPSTEVRAVAATTLGVYVYLGEVEELQPDALHRVEESLLSAYRGDSEILVRRRALEAMGFSSREELPPMIEQAYASNDLDWLVSALFAMGRSADERWNPQVLAMLEHKRPIVRAEAAAAAGELEIAEAGTLLVDLLDDPDPDVRAACIWSLSQIGGEGVAARLQRMLNRTHDDDEVQLLEHALENLAFTEGVQGFSFLDVAEEDDEGIPDDEDTEDEMDDLDEYLDDPLLDELYDDEDEQV